MRVAILSDIHGNTTALDAVLDDVQQRGGADAYWVLGDFAAIGPDPVGALERVTELPNTLFVRGNTDRYVCSQLDPKEMAEQLKAAPSSAAGLIERLGMLTWAQGALNATGWLNWLAALGIEQRVALPDGTRVLLVHASPGTDDGDGIRPVHTDAYLAELLDGCGADLIFTGHTHWQLDRKVGAMRVINLGSVSNQVAPDLRASYYLLQADEQGYALENRRVEYDRAAVIAQLKGMRHPGLGAIGAHMRGERRPPWA